MFSEANFNVLFSVPTMDTAQSRDLGPLSLVVFLCSIIILANLLRRIWAPPRSDILKLSIPKLAIPKLYTDRLRWATVRPISHVTSPTASPHFIISGIDFKKLLSSFSSQSSIFFCSKPVRMTEQFYLSNHQEYFNSANHLINHRPELNAFFIPCRFWKAGRVWRGGARETREAHVTIGRSVS